MRYIITIFCILILSSANAQCEFDEIIPFKIGMTKFEVINTINSNDKLNTISKYNDLNKYERTDVENAIDKVNNGWKKYDYLDKDVYQNVINVYFQDKENCINNKEFHFKLSLVDDYLYMISMSIEFHDYAELNSSYDILYDLIPESYKFTQNFKITDPLTNEQMGECTDFYKLKTNERSKVKLDYVSLKNIINYEFHYDIDKKKYFSTSKVRNYEITLIILNLENTKLTNKGF